MVEGERGLIWKAEMGLVSQAAVKEHTQSLSNCTHIPLD